MIPPWPLATHDHLTRAPAHVAELKRDDLTRSQPESGQQEENGVVAATARRRSVRRRQHTLYLLG